MDYCQGGGLGGDEFVSKAAEICGGLLVPLYQECESRFLRAGLKPAPSAATSPQAGAENQPPACGATTGWGGSCWAPWWPRK